MKIFSLILLTISSLFAHSLEFEAGPSGGGGGSPFTDNPPNDFSQINSITLCGGRYIDSIKVTYEDTSGNIYSYGKHGGNGGSCKTLYFFSGEYITFMTGKYGRFVDSMTIRTNYGRKLNKGGRGGSAVFAYTGNEEFQIVGFKGRSGGLIDSIGVIYFRSY